MITSIVTIIIINAITMVNHYINIIKLILIILATNYHLQATIESPNMARVGSSILTSRYSGSSYVWPRSLLVAHSSLLSKSSRGQLVRPTVVASYCCIHVYMNTYIYIHSSAFCLLLCDVWYVSNYYARTWYHKYEEPQYTHRSTINAEPNHRLISICISDLLWFMSP